MNKLLAFSIIGSSIFLCSNSAEAEWDHWAIERLDSGTPSNPIYNYKFYTINKKTNVRTLRTSKTLQGTDNNFVEASSYIDPITNNLIMKHFNNQDQHSYNLQTDTWTKSTIWDKDYKQTIQRLTVVKDIEGNISFEHAGEKVIQKKNTGEIHIGENSAIFKEENGREKFWAEDASGKSIPIDITNGSKLLINGVSVQDQIDTNKSGISTNSSNIKNLGDGVAGATALTASLTALPQTSKESKLSCGVGTGAYSSKYALGFGCASKVNERVDINAGGSYVFGGSKSYGEGTLDSGVVKAGFVFKLGELKKSTQISMKEKKEFKKEISILKENNEKIISQNKNLATKNQSIIAQNKALLSRLERLEKIALIGTKSKDLAVYKLK